MPQEANKPLVFLQANSKERPDDQPFVVIVGNRDDFKRWLHDRSPDLQWIQVEGLLRDLEIWADAAQGADEVPLDVILAAPRSEFADLYRLVDVRSVRDVRVSMPATPGFLKALRLAASLGLPVRLIPVQPSAEALEELRAALAFYLRDPGVEAPIEFFHSALAWLRGAPTGSLWRVLERDPAIFWHDEASDPQSLPQASEPPFEPASLGDFVSRHLARLIQEGAECINCPWKEFCKGYFKWPDPAYSCEGVKLLFSSLREAAVEIEQDLSAYRAQPA